MRNTVFVLSACAALVLLLTQSGSAQQVDRKPNLSGLWKTDTDVLVGITHKGTSVVAKFIGPASCGASNVCPLHGNLDYFLKGTFDGKKLELTMMRCTHDQDFRDAGFDNHWTTKCNVTTVTASKIVGTYRSEFYQYEDKDGKKVNFRRDTSGDDDEPFSLSRTTCAKELKELVAEIDRKMEALNDQDDIQDEEDKRFAEAQKKYFDAVRDQAIDDTWGAIVPPQIKVIPGAYTDDPATYIESWADFAKELAKKSGNFALEKAAKIVLLYDLAIDWGVVLAKGKTALDEADTIATAGKKTAERRLDNHSAYYSARIEYETLRNICQGEVPLELQPKPKHNPRVDLSKAFADANHFREEADKHLDDIGRSIQLAKSEMATAESSVKNLQELLESKKNADPKKTLQQVFSAAELKQFQTDLVSAVTAWTKAHKAIQAVGESHKKLKNLLSKSLVG